jgi:hypothetical protein
MKYIYPCKKLIPYTSISGKNQLNLGITTLATTYIRVKYKGENQWQKVIATYKLKYKLKNVESIKKKLPRK